ncbi:TetR/AcrR family transcriptional regulator [Amycolatopsis sp. H20-H5]|uniref:TetR/AcrR family transcriptional regulator n=1 Tax=Amycolatopsis sp. H20-H5 TaxID=3046309 RepID=UPI002DBC8777|nr:TetR/AcrR family transcriptional regulator [Amycolatopsis sp. H20-H5]MEC3978665.1 TetR/AcrR family transcriptional regulator [Amycolatopsis sp. H20-H5]
MPERRTQILQAAVRVIAQDGVRGLRVEKLAAEASVSTALIYYHFKDRAGILHAALEHINHRAENYTDAAFAAGSDPLAQLEQLLLLELQDTDEVRENSIAWGELRASAVFNQDLREALRATTGAWNADVEALLRQAQAVGTVTADLDPALTAEHLTALVEGLSERWHSGSITVDRARRVLTRALTAELVSGRDAGVESA